MIWTPIGSPSGSCRSASSSPAADKYRDPGPDALVVIGHVDAIDVEVAAELRRVVVRKGDGRHRRAEHNVDVVEQVEPARPELDTGAALADLISMADGKAAHHRGGVALVVGRQCLGPGVHLLDRLAGQVPAR